MDRRAFLALSAAASSFAPRDAVSGQAEQVGVGEQSEEGVFIEDVPVSAEFNFPPTSDPVRSVDLHSNDDDRRRWALQHITELCKTQTISRGSANVSPLPRKMQNLDDLKVRHEDGFLSLSKFLRDTSTDAFMVMQNGQIITEQYFNGMLPHTPHLIWSCSKSISAGVVANLLKTDKGFRRDSAVTKYIPELKGCGYAGCTIDHLLNMQSSVKYRFGTDPQSILRHKSMNECGRHYRSAEMYPKVKEDSSSGQYAFLQSLTVDRELAPHGSAFSYKDSDTAVLAWVCERVTGTRFVDLLSDFVWSRLGTEHDASIICGPQGACTPAAGMSVRLRDFARWGQMHLQSGEWNGKQIVPDNFVKDVREHRKPLAFNSASYPPEEWGAIVTYRDQFWISRETGAFYALGHCGQICYVHPKSESVIVRFASAKELDPKYRELLKVLADVVRELSRNPRA